LVIDRHLIPVLEVPLFIPAGDQSIEGGIKVGGGEGVPGGRDARSGLEEPLVKAFLPAFLTSIRLCDEEFFRDVRDPGNLLGEGSDRTGDLLGRWRLL
jgi:hypothetical protein